MVAELGWTPVDKLFVGAAVEYYRTGRGI